MQKNNKHTCENCIYFKSILQMMKEERDEVMKEWSGMGLNLEEFGFCTKFEDDVTLVKKDWGKRCKYWKQKMQF